MKATGIVRRIDDLGRVVIPKEVRRMLKIQEGDPLELYTVDGDCVCFKKYNPLSFDPGLVKSVFCSALKASSTIPQALLISGNEVMADSLPGRLDMALENVRDIGERSASTACTIASVDATVSFAGKRANFHVGHIRHIYARGGDYVASILIAPGDLSDVGMGIIQTLAAVIAAMCE